MADVQKIIEVKLEANQAVNGIVNINKQLQTNNQLLKEMADNGQKGSKAYVQLEQQTKALTAEKRVLQREVQNEIKQQSELDGSLKQLRAELSRLTNEYDSLSRAERETGKHGADLKKQINDVTAEIKRAEEGTQRYYRNVGNYQNAILNALGMNNRYVTSIMAITNGATGFNGAMASMGASVKAFGQSLWALMSNPVFLALAGIVGVGMAFKWFYDYNEGIAEANRLTKEFTGYTGDNLVYLRSSIQATADVMGKDFKETLQAVDTLMANFHLDGKQAMEVINKGFAAGADVNGDFLAKVKQLAPTFHDAGIAADEMVAIITQTRSGIFTEQGLDAIRMGSARIREMSKSTREALQGVGIDVDAMQAKLRDGSMTTFEAVKQVSAAIKELPDNAQEVGQVMTAVFGRQGKFASQEMIESLATMSTSLDEVKAKTGEYGELLLENINTEQELDQVTAALFDMSNKGWEETKQKAEIFAKKALVDVVKGIIDVTNWFVKLYNKSLVVRAGLQMIIANFKNIWSIAKWAFNNIVNGFKTIGRVIDAFVNAFSQAGKAISEFGRGVAKIFQGITEMNIGMIQDGVSIIGKGLSSSAASILNGIKSAFTESAVDMIDDIKNFGKEIGSNFAQAAIDAASGTLSEVSISGWMGGGGEAPTITDGGGGTTSPTGDKTGKGGKSTANKQQGETPEEKAYKARVAALIKQGEELRRKALEKEAEKSMEKIHEVAEYQREQFRKNFGERSQYKGEALAAYDALLKDIDKKEVDAVKQYWANLTKKAEAEAKQQRDNAKKLAQAILEGTEDGSAEQLKWRLQLLKMQEDAELAEITEAEQKKLMTREEALKMRNAVIAKYDKDETDIKQEYAARQKEIELSKYQAVSEVAGAMGEIVSNVAGDNKKAAAASKFLALGEIMIAQAVAIARAIETSAKAPNPWLMVGQIAMSVTAVVSAMAQAFRSLDEAKFATGGYVRGAGTATSDSIPARLSNGESVMNANTTSMFGGLLSSLNQLGGGVPIQVAQSAQEIRGEDMLARAVAKGVAMLPAPVVSVEDINRGQRQVEVMNERATL